MGETIRLYALDRAGLTPVELQAILKHGVECRCAPCYKFEVYLSIRNTIQAWEDCRADLARRNTPRRNRR